MPEEEMVKIIQVITDKSRGILTGERWLQPLLSYREDVV